MGQSASRAGSKATKNLRYSREKIPAAATEPNPQSSINPAVKGQVPQESVDGGLTPEELLEQNPEKARDLEIQEQFADPGLAGYLNKLGGSIQGRRIRITPPEADKVKKRIERDSRGRLDTVILKQLYQDAQTQKFQMDGKILVEKLAEEYGVDAEVLGVALKHTVLPVIQEDEDGNLIGSWPKNHPLGRTDSE